MRLKIFGGRFVRRSSPPATEDRQKLASAVWASTMTALVAIFVGWIFAASGGGHGSAIAVCETPVPSASVDQDPVVGDLPIPPGSTPTTIGTSVQGRPIEAYEVGEGPRRLAIVGGIHQGLEGNTSELVRLLQQHFVLHPIEIPEGVALAFIPDMNPDGAAAATRNNANRVDLNRNWDHEWLRDTYTSRGRVRGGGGSAPFSEPETRTVQRYLVEGNVAAAMFFHARAAVVVGPQGGGESVDFARTVADATRYAYLTEWTAYPLSGQAVGYLDSIGIYALDVELSTYWDPEFARNLEGVRAAMGWIDANVPEEWCLTATPVPADQPTVVPAD